MADSDDDVLIRAADELYGGPPTEFLARRTELSKQAARDGFPLPAKQIAALRKPTVPAALVNRMVLADPSTVDRLVDLYDRLRAAHEDLDAGALRNLSTERRTVVGELAAAALALDERAEPPAAVRDDVIATLDAAVADPEVAARVGRLTKPEHWSGFGVAPPPEDGPALTLVRGGRGRTATTPTRASGTKGRSGATEVDARTPSPTNASRSASAPPAAPSRAEATAARRRARARDQARAAFEAADAALGAAEEQAELGAERVKALTAELAALQVTLETTKAELVKARREVKSARGRRREARSALDRIERRD